MKISGPLLALISITVGLIIFIVAFVIGNISVPRRVGPSYSTTDKDTMNLINSINKKLDSYKTKACGTVAGKDIKKVLDDYLPKIIASCTATTNPGSAIIDPINQILTKLFNGTHQTILIILTGIVVPGLVTELCKEDMTKIGEKVNDATTKIGMLVDAMCN